MAELETWSREAIKLAAGRMAFAAGLSPRELQVLQGLADGKNSGEIAAELYVAQSTVKTFLKRLYEKFGVRNAAHAVDIAYRIGVLKVEASDG